MGTMIHDAIVVTSWKTDLLRQAAQVATTLGLLVVGPHEPVINAISTFVVCPDGSKEGWAASYAGDELRNKFVEWLDKQRYEDGSSALAWVAIRYGDLEVPERAAIAFTWASISAEPQEA
jgi:hypothetical protein